MLIIVGTSPAFGAESQGAVSAQSNYETKCARCHGEGGKGNGMQAKMLFFMMKMPNLADSTYMQTRSDDVLFQIIKGGGKAGMPAYGLKLADPEIKDLVAYIRSFTKAPGLAKPTGASR
ncbi:cytochrome c [Candidatus Methylomirabilis sp.]|uniref:Cytochrome c n=1 Tax=Candidatus Methylomirabilis tolerans TaxID=3123416 RepID=A0AAJ1AG72_9BACT|nr:cytochrome c [Candidatus Methylomirabilis sp.]